MEFSEVIKNRYSCKKFSDKEVEKEKLDQILEAGRLAPTAKNLQEQHIYVVQSEKGLPPLSRAYFGPRCGLRRRRGDRR